jgi:hypothetical protein
MQDINVHAQSIMHYLYVELNPTCRSLRFVSTLSSVPVLVVSGLGSPFWARLQ